MRKIPSILLLSSCLAQGSFCMEQYQGQSGTAIMQLTRSQNLTLILKLRETQKEIASANQPKSEITGIDQQFGELPYDIFPIHIQANILKFFHQMIDNKVLDQLCPDPTAIEDLDTLEDLDIVEDRGIGGFSLADLDFKRRLAFM